jgi:hypothetical protein
MARNFCVIANGRSNAGRRELLVPQTIYLNIATASDLNNAILAINAASHASSGTSGTAYVISLAAGATLLESNHQPAIELKGNDTLVIHGNNAIIDGADAHGGIVVKSGTVAIDNLTLFETVQTGGKGSSYLYLEAGGGAGLGGGLLVLAGASVTIDNVNFTGNRAVGGAGGSYYEFHSGL